MSAAEVFSPRGRVSHSPVRNIKTNRELTVEIVRNAEIEKMCESIIESDKETEVEMDRQFKKPRAVRQTAVMKYRSDEILIAMQKIIEEMKEIRKENKALYSRIGQRLGNVDRTVHVTLINRLNKVEHEVRKIMDQRIKENEEKLKIESTMKKYNDEKRKRESVQTEYEDDGGSSCTSSEMEKLRPRILEDKILTPISKMTRKGKGKEIYPPPPPPKEMRPRNKRIKKEKGENKRVEKRKRKWIWMTMNMETER